MNATCCCLNWPLITDRNVNRNHPAGEPATITKEIRMSVTEMLNTPSMAFYVPSCNTIYAWARQQDGEWVTEYGAKTLNAVRRIYPDTELLSFSGVKEAQNRVIAVSGWRFRSPVHRPARVLPPLDWCRGFGGESFKSREFTGGDVTAIFVSVEGVF
jgi:hypothetical protein